MSADWLIKKLSDIATVDGGNAFKSSEYTEDGMFVLRTVNIDDNYSITPENAKFVSTETAQKNQKFALKKHDTLFVMVAATLGKIGYVRSRNLPALLNQNMWVIRAIDGKVDPIFLHYLFRELSKIPLSWVAGSARAFLRRGDVRNLDLKLPPPEEQATIVQTLFALDQKIELNRQMNETLEAMARALFQDWFVDFGPTRRKQAGETDPVKILGNAFPDPTKAAEIAALFPDTLGDDGLPEGWAKKQLGDMFDVVMGQSPPGHTYNESGNGIVFFQGRRDFGFRFPEPRVYCTEPSRFSGKDWTLISVRAPVGDINRAKEKCCIGRGVGALMHKEQLTSYTYYAGLALKDQLQDYDSSGTVFGSINQKQLKSLELSIDDGELPKHFDEAVKGYDVLIRRLTDEMETLAQTRDLLLPKLMSGEIRLKDAV